MGDAVADHLRAVAPQLADRFEDILRRELPAIRGMPRSVLLDHFFELLDGLAAWIEGDREHSDRAFEALTTGHALQRLGHGVTLDALLDEYGHMRTLLGEELLGLPGTDEVRRSTGKVYEGLDLAIRRAIARYTRRRDEIRDRFLGILGHDLRSPLGTISMSAQRLRMPHDPAETARLAERIERVTDRMARMIGELLDFARSHLGGGIPANPTLSDMRELCRIAIDNVRLAHPGCTITARLEGDLRGPLDRDRVLQALGNLLENAIVHGTGPIEVDAHEVDDGFAILTTVTSHGAPIPADQLPRLFEPFERGEPATQTGLGLGLFIVEQIALAHGATCTVTSGEDATRFAIRWPRDPREARLAAAVP